MVATDLYNQSAYFQSGGINSETDLILYDWNIAGGLGDQDLYRLEINNMSYV